MNLRAGSKTFFSDSLDHNYYPISKLLIALTVSPLSMAAIQCPLQSFSAVCQNDWMLLFGTPADEESQYSF